MEKTFQRCLIVKEVKEYFQIIYNKFIVDVKKNLQKMAANKIYVSGRFVLILLSSLYAHWLKYLTRKNAFLAKD